MAKDVKGAPPAQGGSAVPPPPAEGKPKAGICKKVLKGTYKIISSHVGLIVILVLYSFAGAAIFQVIEGRHEASVEASEQVNVADIREDLIATLWNKSLLIGKKQAMFANVFRKELEKYENELQAAFSQTNGSDDQVWDFWGSLFYCATIYTTIGYGHIAPATDIGRVVTMIYAIIGIPLCLIVMADLGKLFTRAIKFPWAFIRRCYYTGQCTKPKKKEGKDDDSKSETMSVLGVVIDDEFDEFNLPPIVAILITIIYILLGAAIYCQWEKWTYLEAFYFIFISISTIGFGDVLPEHPKYFLASSIYVLVGLSLVAMVINVIMEVVSSTIDKAKDKVHEVGLSMGLPLPEDDEEEDEVGVKRD